MPRFTTPSLLVGLSFLFACAEPPRPASVADCPETSPAPTSPAPTTAADDRAAFDRQRETSAIRQVVDDWHDAAAKADEARYFGHLTQDAVFMGTDATERWDKAAFQAYAHPHFAKGKAWSFQAIRRVVVIDDGGVVAGFDEDLATPNLGHARGRGVLRKVAGTWQIAHYNLTITVPNEHFKAVKALLDDKRAQPPPAR